MSDSQLICIEERRYAALLSALKEALFALNIAPRFKVGLTDSYRIASIIEKTLIEEGRWPYEVGGITGISD